MKKKKYKWHKENTPKMAELCLNRCQVCGNFADYKKGVIHHIQYTGNDYDTSLEKLIERKAIKWLCKICHKIEHIATNRTDVSYKIKHSGFCAICNEFAWKAWFNVQLGHNYYIGNNNFPICKKCREILIKNKILSVIELPKSKRKITTWGNLKNLNLTQRKLWEKSKPKIFRDEFGDVNNLKENSKQIKLF